MTRINKVIKAREAKDCGRDSNSAVAAAVAKTRRAGGREEEERGRGGRWVTMLGIYYAYVRRSAHLLRDKIS